MRLWRPDFSDSQPDGASSRDTWDSKCYATFSVIAKYVECEKKYRDFTGTRRFSLVLFSRRHPRAGDFHLMRSKDVAELLEIEERWIAAGRP